MKIIVATDSFKGSLSSIEAEKAICEGIVKAIPEAEALLVPIADGGEGTVEALVCGMGGHYEYAFVSDPLGRSVEARYGVVGNSTAVIEMSAAAGLTLLPEEERNPLFTTTYGVGELIADAVEKGYRDFIIGIGGSATNDGGVGMLQALGFGILDKNGKPVPHGAVGLRYVAEVTVNGVIKELSDCTFKIACDVTNVLCGENGCSKVFAPQKGANDEDIALMDEWMKHYADVVEERMPLSDRNMKGAGAAGGLGFAFSSFLSAEMMGGIDIVMKLTSLEDKIRNADIVITGEGRLDKQSAMGKAPLGVATLAKKYEKTVLAFAGDVDGGTEDYKHIGIDECYSIAEEGLPLKERMKRDVAYGNLVKTVYGVFSRLNN